MFEAYSSNSTQRLLDKEVNGGSMNGTATGDVDEENHNMFDTLEVEYSSPRANKGTKSRGKKKSQSSRTSVA